MARLGVAESRLKVWNPASLVAHRVHKQVWKGAMGLWTPASPSLYESMGYLSYPVESSEEANNRNLLSSSTSFLAAFHSDAILLLVHCHWNVAL